MSREYTPLQKRLLEVLMDDDVKGNIRKAMAKAGYSPETSVMAVIKSLKKELTDIAEEYIAAHAPAAAFGMAGAMEDAMSPDMKEKLTAMKEILDRGGVVKKDGSALGDAQKMGTLFFLPAKKAAELEGDE